MGTLLFLSWDKIQRGNEILDLLMTKFREAGSYVAGRPEVQALIQRLTPIEKEELLSAAVTRGEFFTNWLTNPKFEVTQPALFMKNPEFWATTTAMVELLGK